MKIKILKTEKRLRIKKDEIYTATIYPLDTSKYILVERIPDGYDPCCCVYTNEVSIIR